MLSNTKTSDLAPSGLDHKLQSDVFFGERDSGIPFRSQSPAFLLSCLFCGDVSVDKKTEMSASHLACRTLGK
jgi:hypothetical protein